MKGTFVEMHEKLRAQVRALGMGDRLLKKLREGVEVHAVFPHECGIKRKHFYMGQVSWRLILDNLRGLKKLGMNQGIVWAYVADTLTELHSAKRREAGMPDLVMDYEALAAEWLDAHTNPAHERKIGRPRKDAPVRFHTDEDGRPLMLKPAPSELKKEREA